MESSNRSLREHTVIINSDDVAMYVTRDRSAERAGLKGRDGHNSGRQCVRCSVAHLLGSVLVASVTVRGTSHGLL